MRKNNQFKVIPGLSLTGKDIMQRIKNKSFQPSKGGQYVTEEEYSDLHKMSKIDAARKAVENAKEIDSLRKSMNDGKSKKS